VKNAVLNPSEQLEGLVLNEGWTVGPILPKKARATGGNFCQCYIVRSESGREAFLKALDFFHAFGTSAAVTEVIETITVLFNFERDLLQECTRRNMDRVVKAIASGTVQVEPGNPFAQVPYLIFEKADLDVRAHLDDPRLESSLAWKLRSLHHVATGLKQLHGAEISHQDLKPSNVLVFYVNEVLTVSKVADLGRASRFGHASPFDSHSWAGDPNYAPPEVQYSYLEAEWWNRRISADLYMLGGLLSFIFTKTTSIATLFHALPIQFWPSNWGGTFEEVLPYLINAFNAAADEFSAILPAKLRDDLMPLYLHLCHPDPSKRVFKDVRMNRNALEKYLSKLDLLATRAYVGGYE
jgi:serine/threonine protein kinase